MKKTLVILSLIFYSFIVYSQHEGITRHFKSYKINLTEYSDYTYIADTLTDEFHNFYTQQKLSYNNLGWMNPGQPYMPAVFSQRAKANPFWFFDNYAKFITTHDDIIYFDVQKPFTLFNFTGGGNELELVKFLHTQNITPSLSFAFDYNITNSTGHYQSNKTKVNALSFNTAYTKHRYQSHFNFIMNKINHNENGGLADMAIFDTTSYPANVYSTNLDNAYNTISQIGAQYNHEYRFGTYNIDTIIVKSDTAINKIFESNFSLIHDVKIDRFYRIYEDVPSTFYANTYKSNTLTFDSVAYKTLDNKLLLNFNIDGKGKMQNFQVLAGVSNYLYNYHFPDTVKAKTYFSNYVTGMAKLNTNVSSLSGVLNYCFIGTDAFDMNMLLNYNQRLSKKMGFDAYFDYSLENPSRFLFNYNSNHFRWDMNPAKIYKNAAGINFGFDSIYLNMGISINLLKNYFVYNQFAMPEQISKANLIADAFISKQFNFGSFHWLLKFTYQYIGDAEKVPLPEFVGYTNFYFKKWIFHNALLLQLGADLKYHSGFYGYAYMPAIGAFYLQNNMETGNYPNAAVYAAIKVKRLRGFVKAGNLNSMFMTQQNYLLYAIPDNPFSVNFGISWEFYD
ncbi:MAG: hypothetical protein PHZ24_11885 [Bacteroidales bacterium]|nr:hypothetical protein [Bacteroidales bacterium]